MKTKIKLCTKKAQTRGNNRSRKTISKVKKKKKIQASNGDECPSNENGHEGHESKEGIMNAAGYDDVPEREVSALIDDKAYDREG